MAVSRAKPLSVNHSTLLLQLLLLMLAHLFISVCDARPAPSSVVIASDVISDADDDDDEPPSVFAVFERNDPHSGRSKR